MIAIFRNSWTLLDRRERLWSCALLALVGLTSGVEALSVGAVFPVMQALASGTGGFARLGIPALPLSTKALCLAVFALFVVKNGLFLLTLFLRTRHVRLVQVRLSEELLDGYLHTRLDFHRQRNSTDLIRHIIATMSQAAAAMTAFIDLALEGITALAILALLIYADPVMTLCAGLALGGLMAGLARFTTRRLARCGEQANQRRGLMMRNLHQALGGIRETKVLGCEGFFRDAFARDGGALHALAGRARLIQDSPRPVLEIAMVGLVLALAALGDDPAGGTLPMLAVFAVSFYRLMPSANRILAALNAIHHGASSVAAIAAERALCAAEAEPAGDGAVTFDEAIELSSVTVLYPGRTEPALDDVSLTIRRGESIGLVGRSGAGKTTLADVLLGLVRPDGGQVLVDGTPLGDRLRGWRSRIGYVAQSVYLTDDSLARNVAMGCEHVDRDRVAAVCRLAHLDELLDSLPEGMDTLVGENGARLSGGQRQRIGIARALYHDPEILVFDEPTSAQDPQAEAEIARVLGELKGRRTLVVVAHRLTTLQSCDRLALLEAGRLVAAGSFNQLMETSPLFRELVRHATLAPHQPASGPA